MKNKAQERVEKYFSWRAIAAQTMEFYKSLVRGTSKKLLKDEKSKGSNEHPSR
ncbi:MAG: hypothetical protein H6Q43_171, partial [Deltaproteobacteria bacterium]|nr:hypothetical protein [Deltaproteobacteria bacterium]